MTQLEEREKDERFGEEHLNHKAYLGEETRSQNA